MTSAVAVAQQPGTNASGTSAEVIDPRWGVLGEVAERDFVTSNLFTLGSEAPIVFRWAVPGQELILYAFAPAKGEHRLKLDPATGEIERSWKTLFGTTKQLLQANASGDIVLSGTSDAYFIRKNADGTYWLRWNTDNKQTLTPITTPSAKVQQLLADAHIAPGKASLNRAVDSGGVAAAGGSSSGTADRSAQVPSAIAAGPQFEFLEDGVYTSGHISAPGEAACYLVETAPGQKLQAGATGSNGFDPIVVVGAGGTCDAKIRIYGRNDDAGGGTRDAVVPFVAGGGTYLVQVWSAARRPGDFLVRVRANDAATRKFAPGMNIPRVAQPQFAEGVTASTAPPSGKPAPAKGTSFKDCAECPELVVVPAGSFFMGSNAEEEGHEADEGPRHTVRFARPFAVGKYEVTFDEWDACVKDKGCAISANDNGWGRGRRPVVNITWTDAMQYVRWLRRKTGQNYYLPSESEWEYAARAGTTTPWNTGSAIITDDGNILNALGRTVPVGGYPANAFGLHDTHGNVAEWVSDCYEIGYFGTPPDGGAMASKGCKQRLIRGGTLEDGPMVQRTAKRRRSAPQERYAGVGLRIARSL